MTTFSGKSEFSALVALESDPPSGELPAAVARYLAQKPFRLDVIALLRSPDDPAGYTLRWIENVTEDD